MKSLSAIRFLAANLLTIAASNLLVLPVTAQILECTARSASPPVSGRYPQIVQNGDFRVTGNESYTEIGDSYNEQTRWTCDLSRQVDFSTLGHRAVHAARLHIILTTGDSGWFDTDSVAIHDLGVADPTIRSRKANSRTDVEIDLLEHLDPCAILVRIKKFNGKLPMIYSDDSTVIYAKLRIDLHPAVSNNICPEFVLLKPDLISIDIIAPDSGKLLDEIAIGESFRVRLTYADKPADEITETVTISTREGGSKQVQVTGNGRVIVSGPVTVAPAAQ